MSKNVRLSLIRSRAKALRFRAAFRAVACLCANAQADTFHPAPRATVLMVRAGLPCSR